MKKSSSILLFVFLACASAAKGQSMMPSGKVVEVYGTISEIISSGENQFDFKLKSGHWNTFGIRVTKETNLQKIVNGLKVPACITELGVGCTLDTHYLIASGLFLPATSVVILSRSKDQLEIQPKPKRIIMLQQECPL